MKRAILVVMSLVLAGLLILPGSALAAGDNAPDPLQHVASEPVCLAIPIFAGATVDKNTDKNDPKYCPNGYIPNFDDRGGPIVWYLIQVLKLLSMVIGGIIVLVLVLAGINYITSAADPNGVKTAKKRIQNAVTALILYLMMYAILNFLLPGGILTGV